MPSSPIRRGLAVRGPRAPTDGPTKADLEALQRAVDEIRVRVEPLPGRIVQATKAIEQQHKRLEVLAQALDKFRVQMEAAQAAARDAAARTPIARARDALKALRRVPAAPAARTPAAAPSVAPAKTALPKLDWVLSGGKARPEARAVLVAVFGLDPDEIDAVVAKLVAAAPGDGSLVQVFLTDASAFDAFRSRGVPFEYLPPAPTDGTGRPRDWDVYRARRFALLCEKWQPLEVIALGPAAMAQVAAWGASPHLPDAVRRLLPLVDTDQPAAS